MQRHGFEDDLCRHKWNGQAVARIEISELDKIGTRIKNGETIEFAVDDSINSFFACTMDGSLSNEVKICDVRRDQITEFLTTKGGWRTVSYPYFKPFD